MFMAEICSYECKLCLTLHNNEGNYLAHTQGKRHQTNLAKRAAREAKDAPAQPQPNRRKIAVSLHLGTLAKLFPSYQCCVFLFLPSLGQSIAIMEVGWKYLWHSIPFKIGGSVTTIGR